LAVVDVRQLVRRAELGPRNRLVALENQGSVCPILFDEPFFERLIALSGERLLGVEGVEPGAPTAAEHTVVPLDEPGERVPSVRTEGLDPVVPHRLLLQHPPGFPPTWPRKLRSRSAPRWAAPLRSARACRGDASRRSYRAGRGAGMRRRRPR